MKVVDVWAPWCGPCRLMEPVLNDLESKHGVTVEKVNADEHPELLKKHNISSIPTLLVYDDKDEVINRLVGYKPLHKLVSELGIDSKK